MATAYDLAVRRAAGDRRPAAPTSASGSGRPSSRSPASSYRPPDASACRAILSLVARDTDGDAVALALDLEGIACSVGSACTTGSTEVSHVLTAMGYPEEEARGALRLSLGRTTTGRRDRGRVRRRPAGRSRSDAASARVARRRPTRSGQGVPA